jgi:ubiquinone/menaquinone biosynthesis C-methylase UbiE
MLTFEELKQIYEKVGERRVWDFSNMKTEQEPAPWDFMKIVPQYLIKASDFVFDIGTGGGEKFLKLSGYFEKGIGIDQSIEMVKMAKENAERAKITNITFGQMQAEELDYPNDTFDVIVTRHAPVFPAEVVRVLKPNGYFLTQRVAAKHRQNLKDVFGYHPQQKYANDNGTLIEQFESMGCRVVASGEYNIRYWIKDIFSLIFWLKGRDFPKEFSIEMHWKQVNEVVEKYMTPRGIETNEHRELLIVNKL